MISLSVNELYLNSAGCFCLMTFSRGNIVDILYKLPPTFGDKQGHVLNHRLCVCVSNKHKSLWGFGDLRFVFFMSGCVLSKIAWIPSRSLTWNLKIGLPKRRLIFQHHSPGSMLIFREAPKNDMKMVVVFGVGNPCILSSPIF